MLQHYCTQSLSYELAKHPSPLEKHQHQNSALLHSVPWAGVLLLLRSPQPLEMENVEFSCLWNKLWLISFVGLGWRNSSRRQIETNIAEWKVVPLYPHSKRHQCQTGIWNYQSWFYNRPWNSFGITWTASVSVPSVFWVTERPGLAVGKEF